MDLVINASFMPENGVTISGSGFMTNPGGKGANQAAAIGKLGGNVSMVGCVGEAFGKELKETLSGYGVDTRFISEEKGVSSGIAVIVVVDGDNRIILDEGANGRVSEELIDRALAEAKAGDYLVCQLEIAVDMVLYALEKAKGKGMITLLNPAPAKELPQEIFSLCNFVIPNQSETEFLTGMRPDTEPSILECASFFTKRGTDCPIFTLGTCGSAAVVNHEIIKVDSFKVQTVDTTAAGDTYIGALVTGLSEGMSLQMAMKFASKASSITVTRRGAQQSIPYRKEVLI